MYRGYRASQVLSILAQEIPSLLTLSYGYDNRYRMRQAMVRSTAAARTVLACSGSNRLVRRATHFSDFTEKWVVDSL